MIQKEMIAHLNKQLNLELFSSNLYLQMSVWCNNNKLLEGCKFFKQQSNEEMNHMYRLFDYLNDSDSTPRIGAIDAPPEHFPSFKDIIQFSYDHEKMISKRIHKISHYATEIQDYRTFHFLKWYVSEQYEEERMFKSILDRIELINSDMHGLYFIDQSLKEIRKV
ncbi:ferritin iron storage protein [Wigglesworthia glossinidia endosymbiont of Glossina morsitans morsitans (Yale colony)]|uniref:Ferritin n=1 Tax=Wigglesworthia glossinidia endosymbiont of Glossina morsitans morsitans (Yale colony) TaxID=1142511 RepID=H6Q5A2_WIGGL|nr:non-heme ferritin [Wigglesworthia glossinidia]AFA41385.1 ferritin iron storage protein [Wigglesworthia glossinidia endosymbiont of Glossina morsitans morsitans (Yale colony)]